MPKWYATQVLDNGLQYIKDNAESIALIKSYTAADNYATVSAASIGSVAVTGTDFTLGNQGTNGRKLTSAAKSATASGSSQQYDSGTATSGGSTTLTDSGKAWSTNQHQYRAVKITGGTGVGQTRRIASNTATALTVDTAWSTNPDATSAYVIRDDLHIAWLDVTGTNVLAVTDETSNQVITAGNTINIPEIALNMNQPT